MFVFGSICSTKAVKQSKQQKQAVHAKPYSHAINWQELISWLFTSVAKEFDSGPKTKFKIH